jgi:hypothetical protein
LSPFPLVSFLFPFLSFDHPRTSHVTDPWNLLPGFIQKRGQ